MGSLLGLLIFSEIAIRPTIYIMDSRAIFWLNSTTATQKRQCKDLVAAGEACKRHSLRGSKKLTGALPSYELQAISSIAGTYEGYGVPLKALRFLFGWYKVDIIILGGTGGLASSSEQGPK